MYYPGRRHEVPLWVKSGHRGQLKQCLLYPQKRTLIEHVRMSALCQKATCELATGRAISQPPSRRRAPKRPLRDPRMTGFSIPNSRYHLQNKGSLVVLVLLALVVGVVAGFVGAVFRITLERADRLRDDLITWAHGESLAGFLFIIGLSAVATLVAAWLARRFSPHASGSGIPHVEAVLHGQIPPAPPYGLVPVKFVGGVLAIGSGLALGREGPSVQMGASIAHFVGQVFRREWPDCRVLLAAGAGAGLATAFNAPMAGAVFVLEELVRRFELRIAVAALGASATAIATARVLLGDAPDFHVDALAYASAEARPLFFVLGAVAGLVAIAYNRRRRRCDHAALARRGGDAFRTSFGFSTALRARHGIIRCRNTGRAVRTHARAWRSARLVLRTSLPVSIS